MELRYYKSFTKAYRVLQTGIQDKVVDTLKLFQKAPFAKELHNHALQGKRKGHRSINVTGDYRIIFRELSDGMYELVELIQVGTHSQLYG